MRIHKVFKRLFNKIFHICDRVTPPLPWIPRPGTHREPLVVVGGIARAGNHLVPGLLDGHPHLLMPPDEDYFVRTIARHRLYQVEGWFCSNRKAQRFYNKMQKDGFFERINAGNGANSNADGPVLNLKQYYAYVNKCHTPFTLKGLYQTHFEALRRSLLMNSYHTHALKVYFCVLNPLCNDVCNIDQALSPFYDLKRIFIFRNPLAIYCSAKMRNYYEKGKIDVFCRAVNKYYEDIALLKKKKRGTILDLSFESVVTHTEPVMRQVASFLDIPYADSMIRVTQNGKESFSNSSFEVQKGIDNHVVDRYKEKLTSEEISYIITRCAPNESVHSR